MNTGSFRNVLHDAPSSEDEFTGRGHKRTADALVETITRARDSDIAIGLDGPWGSGKSTVVEIAQRVLADPNKDRDVEHKFFTFDIWQSQGSSFRRSFLERFIAWCHLKYPNKYEDLRGVDKKIKGKERHVESSNRHILDVWGICVISILPFLPIYYFWAKHEFDAAGGSSDYFSATSFKILVIFILITAYWSIYRCRGVLKSPLWRNRFHNIEKIRESLSGTLLISSKQFEDQKVTQFIREIDPNDFEFQSTLREILSIVQSDKSRVVIVLDNIDRLPAEEISDYWAQVRAVFSHGSNIDSITGYHSVTVIVPYDRHLVDGADRKIPHDSGSTISKSTLISPIASREIFAKTFDEILSVSPPVLSNSRDFFMKKVREALTCDLNSDDVFRCYLIFNRILKEDGRAATPREIIAFLNELSGIYALHKRQFSLTTIAVYICYRDALESRPETLNTDDWLDPKLRSLATDPHLERNLAAIIFNVDAELAFQILLDDRIRDAAVGEASELIEIAKAPGFDDRVNDVIEGKAQEWQSSAEFDVVVANFAALSKSHTGHSRNLYARSLVRAFLSVSEIALEPAVYDRLFSIFAFAENNDISLLVERFIRSGYESFEDTPENLMELGQNWSNYLIAVHQQLATMGHPEAINHKNIVLPFYQAPEFIFGLASGLEGTGLELSDLIVDEEYMNDDGGVLPSLAVNYPTRSVATFNHLHRNRFVSDEQWTAIGNAVVTALREPTDKAATLFGPYITLLTSIVGHTDKDHRSKIELDELYAEEVFFERLKAAAGASDRVVALAVFMAIDRFGPEGLPVVYRTQPNPQRRQITSENFNCLSRWFRYPPYLVAA